MWTAFINLLIPLVEALGMIGTGVAVYYVLFTDKGGEQAAWFIFNFTTKAFQGIEIIINDLRPQLATITHGVVNAFRQDGEPIRATLEGEFAAFAKSAFEAVTSQLEKHHDLKPEQWKEVAAEAIADAFSFGLSSFAVTAAFEAMTPEKLNTLNGIGPMLATLAGFEEVTKAALRPMFAAGIATPSTYDANSKFRSVLPGTAAAMTWWARRLLSDRDAKHVAECHGFSDSWDATMFRAAYRPVSPRALATMMQDQPLDRAKMRQILEDNAYSPDHVNFMLDEFEYSSTKNVRQSYVNEALTAYQHGVMPDQELDEILNSLGWSDEAKKFVHERAALARRVILAQKVEQQIIPLVSAGLITPQQGTAQMEAAGIQPWYTDLEVTLATTKATLHQAKLEAAAEEKARLATLRNLTAAAVAEYQAGRIPLAVLSTELTALGLEPSQVASISAVQEAHTHGRAKLVFGQVLGPEDAAVLKEQVAAVEQQFKDNFMTLEQAHKQLADLKIPKHEADALIARWAASLKKTPGSAVLVNPLTGQLETRIAA
ncbi:MAG TPA: hypothetical protein VKH81_03850 [Candidatus Angelobacter sp.]|nr:hypothetical protein [Candidatus Angelobacter sp.]